MGAEGDAPAKSRARTHAVLLSSDMSMVGSTARASGVLLLWYRKVIEFTSNESI